MLNVCVPRSCSRLRCSSFKCISNSRARGPCVHRSTPPITSLFYQRYSPGGLLGRDYCHSDRSVQNKLKSEFTSEERESLEFKQFHFFTVAAKKLFDFFLGATGVKSISDQTLLDTSNMNTCPLSYIFF